jgi:hypothetical protein
MPNKRSVEYWHNKAEESRVIAQAMTHETTRCEHVTSLLVIWTA